MKIKKKALIILLHGQKMLENKAGFGTIFIHLIFTEGVLICLPYQLMVKNKHLKNQFNY